MKKSKKLRSVLVGAFDRREFAEIADRIAKNTQSRLFSDFFEFDHWITNEKSAISRTLPILDLIVVFQSYPGEYGGHRGAMAWERIRQTYPITPCVAVLGSWCEGELRTGFPLSASHRIYANDWFTQGEKEFSSLKNGDFSIWSLPTTFQDEEIILQKYDRSRSQKSNELREKPTAWIFSCRELSFPDREMERLLHTVVKRFEFQSRLVEYGTILSDSLPNLVVWDLGELGPKNLDQTANVLQTLRCKAPNAKIVLLANSPRIEETQTLQQNGADRILSKPFYDFTAIVRDIKFCFSTVVPSP